MTLSPHNTSPRRKQTAGFTLAELIIATSLGTIVAAGVLSTFLLIARTGMRMQNYSEMETQTRLAFEQFGIDARMASAFTATFSGGEIKSITLTIPNTDLSAVRQVTYGYDTSDGTDKKFFMVSGSDPTATVGRTDLITEVKDLRFLRYNASDNLIPASTVSSTGIKHIQVAISVSRTEVGVAAATQVIRSSAFTLRNISI